MNKQNNIERKGLPGGPNEVFTYTTGVFSTEGYKKNSPDVGNPFNIINSGNITMKDVDFPVMGTDNLGNSQMMMPGNDYQFPGNSVLEVPKAQFSLPFGMQSQPFNNIYAGDVRWAKGIPGLEWAANEEQGVNVSGINLSKNFNLGKNLNLNLSNPALVYANPMINNKGYGHSFKPLPFQPKASLTYKFQDGGPHGDEITFEDKVYYMDPNNNRVNDLKQFNNDPNKNYISIDGKNYKVGFSTDKNKINYKPEEHEEVSQDEAVAQQMGMSVEDYKNQENTKYADAQNKAIEEQKQSLASDGFDEQGNYAAWRDKGYSSADDYYDMMGDQGKYSYASMAKDMAELTAKKIKNDPMGALHIGLEGAGMAPGLGIVPDMINAGLYGLEGMGKSIFGEDAGDSWENMGYASSAAIPLAGLFATPAKYVKKGYQKLKPKNLFKSSKPKLVDQTQIKNIANDPMVRVYTSDGSVKMMPKSQAIRLSRVEDANIDPIKLQGYESGNWFASEPLDFYNQKTKRGLNLHESAGKGEYGRSYLLDPSEPRRLFTTHMDPEDAVHFNILNSSQRAKNMSGGIGDPLDYEFVLPPDMVNRMRKVESGPGFNVQYGNYDDIGKYMDDFYKKYGGMFKAQNGGPTVKQRKGVRENSDGSVSSHLMKAEYIPEVGWVGFPSLFQNEDETWVDMSQEEDWMKIYKEAEKRGEVYSFGEDKEAALAFGMGSWKDQLPNKSHGGSLPKAQIGMGIGYNRPQYNEEGNIIKTETETNRPEDEHFIRDFTYTQKDFDFLNNPQLIKSFDTKKEAKAAYIKMGHPDMDPVQQRRLEYEKNKETGKWDLTNMPYCPGGQCLEQTFDAYDMMVGQNYPSTLFPSEANYKKALNLQSASERRYRYIDDENEYMLEQGYEPGLYLRDPNDPYDGPLTPIGSNEKEWLESVPYFDYKNSMDLTADSWDIHGQIVHEGGTNLWTRGVYKDQSEDEWRDRAFWDLSEDKKKEIYEKIPVGAIIGFGADDDEEHKGYNNEFGLSGSGHSAMVVGFDERGVPVIYDYGQYTPIDSIKGHYEGGMLYGAGSISNISYPKELEGRTRSFLEEEKLLNTTPSKMNFNFDALAEEGDAAELTTFYDGLKNNKTSLMNDLNIKNEEYDDMAKMLMAISMQETSGGSAFEHNIQSSIREKDGLKGWPYGSTQGLTQLNIDNILDDPKLARIAKKYGITKEADLFDNRKAAIASMIFAYQNKKSAETNYKKGKKEGIRTLRPNSRSKVYDGDTYMTEEGVSIWFENLVGWDYSLKDIQAEFDKVKKDRYKVYKDDDGTILVDKKTFGNSKDLTDQQKFIYNWQSPNSLSSGDAQGKSTYSTQILEWYNKMKVGGELEAKNIGLLKSALGVEIDKIMNKNTTLTRKHKLINNLTNQYNNMVPSKYKEGGPVMGKRMNAYKDYIDGNRTDAEARSVYDKLNRVYYSDSKQKGLSPQNYIMSHIIGT